MSHQVPFRRNLAEIHPVDQRSRTEYLASAEVEGNESIAPTCNRQPSLP